MPPSNLNAQPAAHFTPTTVLIRIFPQAKVCPTPGLHTGVLPSAGALYPRQEATETWLPTRTLLRSGDAPSRYRLIALQYFHPQAIKHLSVYSAPWCLFLLLVYTFQKPDIMTLVFIHFPDLAQYRA